jgi:hypothetical protein
MFRPCRGPAFHDERRPAADARGAAGWLGLVASRRTRARLTQGASQTPETGMVEAHSGEPSQGRGATPRTHVLALVTTSRSRIECSRFRDFRHRSVKGCSAPQPTGRPPGPGPTPHARDDHVERDLRIFRRLKAIRSTLLLLRRQAWPRQRHSAQPTPQRPRSLDRPHANAQAPALACARSAARSAHPGARLDTRPCPSSPCARPSARPRASAREATPPPPERARADGSRDAGPSLSSSGLHGGCTGTRNRRQTRFGKGVSVSPCSTPCRTTWQRA